jgi:HlyD family secretion protein
MATPKSKKRRKILIFAVIGLVLVALTLVAVFKKREPAIRVETGKVTRTNIMETVVANGRIQPVVSVKISAEVSGEIIELPVKEGQRVKKGDRLVRIKQDVYEASRRSLEAGYRSALSGQSFAEASLKKADLELKRNEELFHNKLISDSTYLEFQTAYDMAKAQAESARHQVEVAAASLSRAEEELAKTTIVSPLTGTVSKLNLEVGERVAGNTMMAGTEIMTIAELNEMEARVDIGEVDIVLVSVGQKATLEVDAFRDRTFKGVVTEIANSSKGAGMMSGGGSQDATKFEVRIRVAERESFRPGMSVTAEIETRARTNVLCVPVQCVTTRPPKSSGTNAPSTNATLTASEKLERRTQGEDTKLDSNKPGDKGKPIEVVFAMDGEKVKMVPVKRGINDDTYAEIIEGLKEGDEIITGGYKAISRELEDGKKVRKEKPDAKKDKKEQQKK